MFSYHLSGCSHEIAPSITKKCLFVFDGNGTENVYDIINEGNWGKPYPFFIDNDNFYEQIPCKILINWVSVIEKKNYLLCSEIPRLKIEQLFSNGQYFSDIIVGMAPYGGVALWTHGFKKSTLVAWMHAEETQVEMKDFMPLNPNVTLDEICDFYINNDLRVKETLQANGFPPRDLFDNYMKQFTYRYLPIFEHWNEDEEEWLKYTKEEQETKPELDYVEEALFDGTHDKLHDGGLLHYHEAGKPKKLAIKWHIKKSEYTAYFWFEDEAIRAFFDRFYGIHPDTKTDFILHIDPEKKKYELSLFRYGLPEPKIIPEDAYQLIVFKNKFEHFRSENYEQPRGAWIW